MTGIVARLWRDGAFRRAWMVWQGGFIARAGFGNPPRSCCTGMLDLGETRVVPGFTDTLLHGFAGVDATFGKPDELDRMSRELAAHGVTSALAGLYPAPNATLRAASRRWNRWRALGRGGGRTRFEGWHLEGPFVAPEARGQLPARGLTRPSAAAARRLVAACDGWLRLATVAPELDGADAAIHELRRARVVPSIGHTACGWHDCARVNEHGQIAMTHLGNAMPPLMAREPGPVGYAMEGRARWVGVIPDLEHVAAETLGLWARTPALRPRLMAQSDALSHAGLRAEAFESGGAQLHRAGVVARDAEGRLAGGLEPLPVLLDRAVRRGALGLAQAVSMGCEVPGDFLGKRGRFVAGHRADFCVLEGRSGLRVAEVWMGGRRLPPPETTRSFAPPDPAAPTEEAP